MMEDFRNVANGTLPRRIGSHGLAIIYLVASILVMAANGVVVFVVVKTKALHMPTLWIVTWMAIFDFLIGLYTLVFVVPSAFLNRYAYSERTVGFASCTMTFLLGQAVFNISMTVIERCIAVCWPLRYTHIVTTKRFVTAVFISLFLSLIRLILITVPDGDFYYNEDVAVCIVNFNTAPTVAASIGFPMATLSLIFICFVLIGVSIRRARKKVHPEGVYIPHENQVKLPVMCLVSTSVFIISYLPFFIGIILNYISGKENVSPSLVRIIMVGLLSNSFCNVFVYTGTYTPFREALTYIFCRSYFRNKRRHNILSMANM